MHIVSLLPYIFLSQLIGNCRTVEAKASYKDYHAININITSYEELNVLEQQAEYLDFWSLPKANNSVATVMIALDKVLYFLDLLKVNNIKYNIFFSDLEEVLEPERHHQILPKVRAAHHIHKVPLDHYARHKEINAYLDDLANRYPKTVRVKSAGQSYENRTLKYIRISNGDSRQGKKTFFVDAGIHAREWIAPATALYIIHQLVELADHNQDLLANIDWIVLPCVNPDGYEYSHVADRMWRKTRSPNTMANCPGTDGNRNFGFKWGGADTTSNECNDAYRGSKPFSEPETQAVRDIMKAFKYSCKFYLTLHSYGQYLLYPWAFQKELPDNWRDLDEVAQIGASTIRKATGTEYKVGSTGTHMYVASGGSDDYAMGVHGIPFVFTMELSGGGDLEFDPPSSAIEASVKESWIGIRAMAVKVNEKSHRRRE